MACELDRLHEAFDRSDNGVHVVALPPGDAVALFQAGHLTVARHGYVPVLAERGCPPLGRTVLQRHVLIVCAQADAVPTAIGWVRQLAQASPRRHLVATLGSVTVPLCAPEAIGEPDAFVGRQLQRAERWRRRGRARTAARWLAAAAEAARRRGEGTLAAQIDVQCAQVLCDRDEVAEVEQRIRRLLRLSLDWGVYGEASAVRIDTLIAREEYAAARAWIASLQAEAWLRGQAGQAGQGMTGAVRARVAELDFWQGRDASQALDPAARATPDEIGWQAVRAWSRADQAGLALIAGQYLPRDPANDSARAWWAALVRVMLASDAGEAEATHRIKSLAAASARTGRARHRRLAALVTARTWLARERPDRASTALVGARGPGPEGAAAARLQTLLVSPPITVQSRPVPRQPRLPPGVEFLALRSSPMNLVDGLAGLLAVIEDSEDDAAVLAGGCRWVCRQTAASAVGVVSADRATLVAAEGWRRADMAGEIAAILAGPARDARLPDHDAGAAAFGVSVRYGGLTIGHVVARGMPGERSGLQQAVQAFAALCGSALRSRIDAMSAPERARDLIPEIVGESPAMTGVREAIARAALAPFPILIEGESGTGKELVARALHRLGPRRDRKLCAVNCAALTDELVEAELFGHTRGAFTGAVAPRAGLFEEASGGTLFLDEVAELSVRAQAKLLRVLQEREIRRVGENASRAVDVRVITATNVWLHDAVSHGRFRDDLRFRLAVVRIRVPPLRDRLEDVAPLARAFWRRAAAEAGTRAALGPDALVRLSRHLWPGNVRELQNVISSLVVAVPVRGRVTARHVDQLLAQTGAGLDAPVVPLDSARRTFERRVIAAALVRHAGRRSAAATELGLTRQGLTKALRRLGLSADEDAAGVA